MLNRLVFLSLMAASLTFSGCASFRHQPHPSIKKTDYFSGRFSLTMQSNPPSQVSANFSLSGTPNSGQLVLSTPFGLTLGEIMWHPNFAHWKTAKENESFSSLNELMTEKLGTNLPVMCFFMWLQNKNCEANGWTVDLSGYSLHRIAATTKTSSPPATLTIAPDDLAD